MYGRAGVYMQSVQSVDNYFVLFCSLLWATLHSHTYIRSVSSVWFLYHWQL